MGRSKFHCLRECLFLMMTYSLLIGQIILNEMMIDPLNENSGEFIELYNNSDSIIDLSTYYLCDEQDTDKLISFPDSLIEPHNYALILDPNYEDDYAQFLPDTLCLLSINDSRFGKYGISNSTEKTFSILDDKMNIIDSYRSGTPIWPQENYSIERYFPNQNVWMNSILEYGSPGQKNSISPKNTSIRISKINSVVNGDSLKITFNLINNGTSNLKNVNFSVSLIFDSLLCELNQTFAGSLKSEISSFDSISTTQRFPVHCKGLCTVYVIAFTQECSDTLSGFIHIPLTNKDLIISEFVCKPKDVFSCEYIELISKCSIPIQLSGLKIYDLTGYITLDTSYVLMPDSLIVIAQSKCFYDDFPFVLNTLYPDAWRSLNNSEDIIHIKNCDSSSICNLRYDNNWDLKNDCAMLLIDTSLNYQLANNWECLESGSPGKINQTQQHLKQLKCHIPLDLYTPFDTLILYIINVGYKPIENSILNIANNYIDIPTLFPNDTFVYLPDTSVFSSQGTHKISISCSTFFNTHLYYYRPFKETPCFINEIMFSPLDAYGQYEFIEIENRHLPMIFKNWSLRVNNNILQLSDSSNSTFTVFCDLDESIYYHSNYIPLATFPSLPNAGAEIMLTDPMGRIIDKCDLRDHKNIFEGKSIEKQFLGVSSNDYDLWYSCVSNSGMSPGQNNSITACPGSLNSLGIYPKIFSPGKDTHIQFSIDSKNSLNYCDLRCYNLAGQLIYHKEQNCFSQASALIFWDGRLNDNSFPARGIYLVSLTLYTVDDKIFRLKNSLIVK